MTISPTTRTAAAKVMPPQFTALLLLCTTTAYQPPHRSHARSVALRDAQRTYTLTDGKRRNTDLLEVTTKGEGRTFVLDGSKNAHVVRVLLFEGKLGYQVWPAALAGAAWACKNKALCEGKRVLELGWGGVIRLRHCRGDGRRSQITLTDLDAVSDRDFDAPSGLLDAQRRTCIANGFEHVDSQQVDWADSELTGSTRSTSSCAPIVYTHRKLSNRWRIAYRAPPGRGRRPVRVFGRKGLVRREVRARSSQRPRGGLYYVGLRVETSRSSIGTAAVCTMLSYTPSQVIDDTTTGVDRRSVLGATALAFAPRAHAVEADPRTDIQGARGLRREGGARSGLPDVARKRAQGRARARRPRPVACGRATPAWSRLIMSAASSTAACSTGRVSRGDAWGGEVLKGLELGLYDMCIGERHSRCHRRWRWRPRVARFGVPGGATLEYDVTLRGINLQYDPAVGGAPTGPSSSVLNGLIVLCVH